MQAGSELIMPFLSCQLPPQVKQGHHQRVRPSFTCGGTRFCMTPGSSKFDHCLLKALATRGTLPQLLAFNWSFDTMLLIQSRCPFSESSHHSPFCATAHRLRVCLIQSDWLAFADPPGPCFNLVNRVKGILPSFYYSNLSHSAPEAQSIYRAN